MNMTRGEFLKLAGGWLGGVLLGPGQRLPKASLSDVRMSALYDMSKCVGCRACQMACKRWNKLPTESTYQSGLYESPRDMSAKTYTLIKLAQLSTEGERNWSFCKYQCMHCTDASCVNVCPTGAAAHRGEYVMIDQNWCIGCGYCVMACPFGAVHLGKPEKGSARKCTFCFDRITVGQIPACIQACPAGALDYGERSEMLTKAKARVATLQGQGHSGAQVYGEREVRGTGWIYVLADQPAAFGLPEKPQVATTSILGQWVSGLVAAGAVCVLSVALLGRGWQRQRRRDEK
ncbi:MAG: 4Fe-4S dicluster domain-containing protein [Anaerolineae bacterium]